MTSSELLNQLFKDKGKVPKDKQINYDELANRLENSPTITMNGIKSVSKTIKEIREEDKNARSNATLNNEQQTTPDSLKVDEIHTGETLETEEKSQEGSEKE